MTGEEHYREAERLLAIASIESPDVRDAAIINAAGVHAQLAIAAVYVTAEAKSS